VTETTVAPERPITVEEGELAPGFIGQNVARKEDRRLVEGQGVFVDDVKRHEMAYVHFVRSPYAHAAITRIDVSRALELDGVYGTLIGEEVAAETDPFFQIAPPPAGETARSRRSPAWVVAQCRASSRQLPAYTALPSSTAP
jgi:CO/xanthine dehydrogenase Mo-binding subunit